MITSKDYAYNEHLRELKKSFLVSKHRWNQFHVLVNHAADDEKTAEQRGIRASLLKQNAHVCGGVLVRFLTSVPLRQISIMFDDFRHACHFPQRLRWTWAYYCSQLSNFSQWQDDKNLTETPSRKCRVEGNPNPINSYSINSVYQNNHRLSQDTASKSVIMTKISPKHRRTRVRRSFVFWDFCHSPIAKNGARAFVVYVIFR